MDKDLRDTLGEKAEEVSKRFASLANYLRDDNAPSAIMCAALLAHDSRDLCEVVVERAKTGAS